LYEFSRFRFDPENHLLESEGTPISLTPKAFEILLVLVENGSRLTTKEELMRRVWPDSFVEEANLTVNISALRKQLGEASSGQQYIETVPKKGYRFGVPVSQSQVDNKIISERSILPSEEVLQQILPPVENGPFNIDLPFGKTIKRRSWLLVSTTLVGLLIVVLGAWGYRVYRNRSTARLNA